MTGHRTWMRRVVTVGAVLTVCSVAGAGSASASSPTTAQNDLLGLNALVGGVTAALTGPQSGAAARPAGESTATSESSTTSKVTTDGSGLAGTVEKLPLVGPLLGSVVADLGLGETEKPAPAVVAPEKPAKPAAPAAPVKNESGKVDREKAPIAKPQMSPVGSTWTAPRVGTVDEPAGGPLAGVAGSAADVVRNVSQLLPETAAGKAGVGAAALALIVLGGVAVAGAAGAAGAAGRRGLVGGAW